MDDGTDDEPFRQDAEIDAGIDDTIAKMARRPPHAWVLFSHACELDGRHASIDIQRAANGQPVWIACVIFPPPGPKRNVLCARSLPPPSCHSSLPFAATTPRRSLGTAAARRRHGGGGGVQERAMAEAKGKDVKEYAVETGVTREKLTDGWED